MKTDCWECKHFSYEADTNAAICDLNKPDTNECDEYSAIFEDDDDE
jgi:hypothetical protein